MNKPIELLCTHSILICAACIGIGVFLVAGWLPAVPPSMDANAVAEMFASDRTRIMIGATIAGFGSMFYWSFAGAIATQMRRIEGEHHPLTRIQLLASNGTALALMFLAFLILAMAYRTGVEPTALQLMNDYFWLVFVGLYPPGVMQNVAIGLCILSDKKDDSDPEKVYPRWVGYANFWVAVLFIPGIYIVFFKSGPFAWHGIFGLWVVAAGFFFWVVVMWLHTVKAIRRA